MPKKILYIHPSIRSYRVKLFNALSKKFNITFFWSASNFKEKHINDDIENSLKENNLSYIQANELKNIGIDNFSWKLFSLPFFSYDIFIFSSIISVPTLLLLPIVKLLGKKTIIFDELWRYPKEHKKYKLIYPYVYFLLRYCVDSIIVAGSKSKEFMQKEFTISDKTIFIAYNTTLDAKNLIDKKQLIKTKKQFYELTTKKCILFLGRVIKIKGLDILIKSMANISKDYDLIVIGNGNDLDKCKQLAKTLSLKNRVHFLNDCTFFEAIHYIRCCDLFVLPSRKILTNSIQVESWGFTVNEAMSLETPVVTTTAVGSSYDLIIPNKTGQIAKESNPIDLALKINEVLNKNINNNIGKNAREHLITLSSVEQNLDAYTKAIKKVINE